jgi:hypothetical protein
VGQKKLSEGDLSTPYGPRIKALFAVHTAIRLLRLSVRTTRAKAKGKPSSKAAAKKKPPRGGFSKASISLRLR